MILIEDVLYFLYALKNKYWEDVISYCDDFWINDISYNERFYDFIIKLKRLKTKEEDNLDYIKYMTPYFFNNLENITIYLENLHITFNLITCGWNEFSEVYYLHEDDFYGKINNHKIEQMLFNVTVIDYTWSALLDFVNNGWICNIDFLIE